MKLNEVLKRNTVSILLYLKDNPDSNVNEMFFDNVASQSQLYSKTKTLEKANLILSKKKDNKTTTYKLSADGKRVAKKLKEIERLIK